MLSTQARPANAARRVPHWQEFATVVLALVALCVQTGCAGFVPVTIPSPAPLPEEAKAPEPGSVRVLVHGLDPSLAAETPTVVYLANLADLATDREMPVFEAPSQEIAIGRNDSGLSPAFIAAAVEQSLMFRIDDDIHHHIFSKSEVGAFDLGPLGKNESKRISFHKPGMLRLYCSLHPSENAALYVAPSPHFAKVPASGEVMLRGLLPGRYQVHTWNESGPPLAAQVVVRPGAVSTVELGAVSLREGD